MATIVTNSRLFGDTFGTPEMRAIFSEEALVGRYLEVEVALALSQAALGIVPAAAASEIERAASVERVDWDRLASRTKVVGYPILPLVEQLAEWTRDDAGQWAHWGATTQDIMDTADVLQIRDALDLVSGELDRIAAALAGLAADHADTPMAGRTHLQHALPVSLGFKAAVWLSAIDRHRARLAELRPRVECVSFGGAVGTLASLGEQGLSVRAALARELHLGEPAITWHAVRDGFAETTGLLALICGTLGKIAYDIMLMMQTETGEALEPFQPGRGASSTMPQKRNPIGAEMMLASAKIVREQHSAMLDAMVLDHERATGQWHVEWHALPTAFVVASGGLRAARETLEGLEVRPEAMRRVLDSTGGLIVAEAVMMGLAPDLGRQKAHDLVYDCCRTALDSGRAFLDCLSEEPEIAACKSRRELADLVDPANYLGAAPRMIRDLLNNR